MDPEQSQKSTKKAEESPRKRLTKGEAFQSSISSAATYQGSSASSQATPLCDIISQQHFSGSLPIPREESQEKTGHQKQPRPSSFEHSPHISQLPQHPLSPAFMSPGKPEQILEGPTWQLVDPVRPGPSGSFSSPGIHSHHSQLISSHSSILPGEDISSVQKVYIPRPSQVSLKQTEEVHKKEKKPQKPGKYICQYCSRPCAKPSVLQKHIRSHTGERPYPCIPCGFSFKTKSNLYKHRKSHAHRIKAGLASGIGAEMYPSSLEMERIGGEEFEEPTEGESTDSEEETSAMSCHSLELSPRQKHTLLSSSLHSVGSQGSSHDRCSLSHSSMSQSLEDSTQFVEPSSDHVLSHKSEDTHSIKQKLALRLSERKKVIDEQAFLSPGSKGSTESGYFSRSESAEQQISPPNTNAKSYAEIILGKCGRIGQRTAMLATTTAQGFPHMSTEDKPSMVPLSVPRTQVIEHITKLITINEAVVDTSEIDSVKPRRSSLSRRSSIESPKSGVYREPFQFDSKSGSSSQLSTSKSLTSHGEKMKPEQSPLLSLQQPHSATDTVPLLRSHSMPSAACTISSPQTFRGSYSFDDRIMESDVLSRSQVFSSHPRMLKRQPAIELPLGVEYGSEEVSTGSKESASKPAEEQEIKESDLTRKSRRGPKVKGFIYECNICGARYKKRDNYEAHKKYYCSELQVPKPHSSSSHTSSEAEKSLVDPDAWPQMMHYKLGTSLELTPLRKRRKEKSLGDDEDPPAFELPETPSSSVRPVSQFANPASSDVALNLPRESIKSPADAGKAVPLTEVGTSAGFHSRMTKPAASTESKERRKTSKEISVIQHTSSFEKSDSLEQLSSLEVEEKSISQYSSQPVVQHSRPSHSLQPKLVRQSNIQVPEILVTEEPDRPETEPEPPPKEPEKTEEFQWPQRSQTLSQLPAEKLPPKKKRLRLAEMAQSSGESSFESISLTRSPSQESSISHSSSHSMSFDREEYSKSEAVSQPSESHMKPLGIGSHMLTVPSHHHHSREMRRSASEQTPNVSHPSQMSESRSKSFDYGSLSSSSASMPGPSVSSAPQERRKCFLVRQASLATHPEHEADSAPKGKQETEELLSPSNKSSATSLSTQPTSSSSTSSHADKGQPKDSSPPLYNQPYTEALQVFHHPVPQIALHEKQRMSPQASLFPFQHLLPQPGQAAELFSTHAMSDILSAQFPVPPSLFQAPPLPLQQALLHPGQLHVVPPLMSHPAEVPFRQHPSFLPVHYPGSSPLPSTFFLPLQSPFAVQLPGEVSGHLPQIKSSVSPPTGASSLSPCTEYSSDSRLHPSICTSSPSASISTSQLVVPTCPDPTVSLVVPVRIQTNMPTYGSAMYTTLSQILVTQSQSSPSSIVLPKFDDCQPKGALVCSSDVHGVGFDLAQMITEDQRSIFHTPYLRVPLPLPERKGYMPLTCPSESVLGLEGGSSTVGGSKRMLSPAGSLELTMETQQQKRVKEEEVSEAEENLEVVKSHSANEEGKKKDKSHFLAERQGQVEVETPPSLSSEQSEPKEIPRTSPPGLPHSGASTFEALGEYIPQAGKQFRSKTPLQVVKKEDSKELVEHAQPNPSSPAPHSDVTQSAAKSQEGTDLKKVLQFPSLHTTTNVSWCYLNYIKPNHIQQVDRRSSVYASWCISLYNPNLPGISTKAALSLLRSKQKVSKEIYTMATAPRPETGRLVPSSSRKPKMTEVHLPSLLSNEGRKDLTRAEKEEDKRGKSEEEAPISKRGEPARIKIFEGGYKSNEEYVYVRGRGRGKYVCEECGIRCKKPSMLKKHIRTHTDVRPYVCKYCNFAFKTKGNLTKHMKSKAHSKKCQEMGVLVSSLVELEAEEGTSEDLFQDSEGREGSEPIEEHQFSDLEESDDDDENEDDEDEEGEESQDEPPLKFSEVKHTSLPVHSLGSSPSAPEKCTGAPLSFTQDIVSSSQQVGRGQPTTSSGLETKWSADSSEVCHSFLSLHRPALTSSEHLAPAERESVTKQQMLLAMDLSTSKDSSPRRKWSPGKDSGVGGSGSRPMLARKHLLTKNETSPKRFSPTGEMSSLRCLSPGRGMSPSRHMSPRRESSPLRCVSPRLELSPSRHPSPRRELSPRMHLPTERGASPVRHSSPSREIPSIRYLSLKKILPPGCSEPLSRYPSPGKEDLPCSSKSAADDQGQSSFKGQHGILASMPLPHRFLGKSAELSESKLKIEPRSPACSPGNTQPICSRALQAPYELHVHAPSRGEENVFSHLPLHSQQLTRTPYPMIPIGGIQMVQARPSTHPSLVPKSVMSLQAGCFAPSGNGSSSFTKFSPAEERGKEPQVPQESSSVSPAAKVSKYTLSPQLQGSGCLEEKMRTSEHQQKTEQEEYRVKKYAEPSHSEQEGCSAPTDCPSTNYEHSPKPSTSGDEPLKKPGKKQCGSSSTYFDSSCTFISDFPAQMLDRSSSTGCLSEPSLSHSHSHQFSVRRRNLSGEPSHQGGAHRKSSPHLERTRFSQTQRQVDENTGST